MSPSLCWARAGVSADAVLLRCYSNRFACKETAVQSQTRKGGHWDCRWDTVFVEPEPIPPVAACLPEALHTSSLHWSLMRETPTLPMK